MQASSQDEEKAEAGEHVEDDECCFDLDDKTRHRCCPRSKAAVERCRLDQLRCRLACVACRARCRGEGGPSDDDLPGPPRGECCDDHCHPTGADAEDSDDECCAEADGSEECRACPYLPCWDETDDGIPSVRFSFIKHAFVGGSTVWCQRVATLTCS